uniref:F-box domain-containing protein n=2 Tax=Oryza TaxID=4527 RepID=A0A0D3HHR9_9ORYZ
MAETVRLPEQQRRRPLTIANLPEEILSEILLLLPPKSILQCRAVCKAWRDVTSDRAFLLAHHCRQPPQRLLTFIRDVGSRHDDLDILDYCVEAVDFRTHQFQSLARFTGQDYDCSLEDSPFTVHASCDGLLLMSYNNYLHLCNPTTRQWLWVFPPALQHDTVLGLYSHGHSSEYRVLYYREIGLGPEFYISIVGSGKERSIWPHSSSASLRKWLAKGKEETQFNEPFLFHGNLHWLPHLGGQNKIVVFDTLDEVFRWLHVPFKMHNVSSLLEIEGSLAMSNSHIGSSKVDLWLLQDYKHMVWVHKYRIELPVIEIRRFEEDDGWYLHIVSQEGDVLVDGFDWQFHYDIKGNLLEKFQCSGRMLNITPHILQESLVPHEVFQILDNETQVHMGPATAAAAAAEAALARRAADPLPALRRRDALPLPLPARLFAQLHGLLLTAGLARHSPNFSLLRLAFPLLPVPHLLRLLLSSPLPPTTFLANSLLLASSSPGCLPSALSLYVLLFLSSSSPPLLRPNAFTYPPLFRAAPPALALALATHSIKFLGAHAASCDRLLGAALLDVFARCGRIASCRKVFDRIANPDLPAWNALLSAYARLRARDQKRKPVARLARAQGHGVFQSGKEPRMQQY